MPEKEAVQSFWSQLDLYIAMAVFGSVLIAKNLIGEEPINPKRLAGELILSSVGAGVFHAFGLLQGLNGAEYWMLIFLAAMGGLRAVEWSLRIFIALKKVSL